MIDIQFTAKEEINLNAQDVTKQTKVPIHPS